MTVQPISISRPGNHFFNGLPGGTIYNILDYLRGDVDYNKENVDYLAVALSVSLESERAILVTAAVCKAWKDNPILQHERGNSKTRFNTLNNFERENYPQRLNVVFRKYNLPISRLSELDLGGRAGWTDHIDFLKPSDLTHPIMKFTDRNGRRGIVFHKEGYTDRQVYFNGEQTPIRNIAAVQAFFQRYTDDKKYWVPSVNGGELMALDNAIIEYYEEHPKVKQTWIGDPRTCGEDFAILLEGKNPCYRIGMGYVPSKRAALPVRGLLSKFPIVTALAILVFACLAETFSKTGQNQQFLRGSFFK